MKSIINILLMGSCFLCSPVFATNEPDSFNLLIEGKVLNAGLNAQSGCSVELVCDNMRVDSFVLHNPKRMFAFHLQKNRQYTLRLKQEGYIDKVITINTAIPFFMEDAYGFEFETSLMESKDKDKLNQDIVELPVARIYFDAKKGHFYYDKAYTDNIRRELLARGGGVR